MSAKFSLCFFFLVSLLYRSLFAAFLAPVTIDFTTKKYTLSVYLNTPPHLTNLLLDIGASLTVIDCSTPSSSQLSAPCSSRSCSSSSLACSSGDSCIPNSVTTEKSGAARQPRVDSLYLHTTDGRNPGELGIIPEFMFSCTKRSFLKGLVKGAAGLAGLGRSSTSLPAQVSNGSSEDQIFALCLSGSPSAPGVAFFGSSGPYYFLPEIDLSKVLFYTPLLLNPAQTITKKDKLVPSKEYFIDLTSILVNGKPIEIYQALLTIDEKGIGGTKLSTVTPYTALHTKIFEAFTEAFVNESAALNLTVTDAVKPFRVCYNADDVLSTQVGPGVPTVDLVMHDRDVIWRIFGSNSMVRIFRDGVDVWCLGFIDDGEKPKTSVVIGGHQLEDNLLQFDLEAKKLGFSSSVLVHNTMCANFNFTTNDDDLR